jgi:hypothetical protein
MTASESGNHIGCQTEQLILDKNEHIMFSEKEGTEKSLIYF